MDFRESVEYLYGLGHELLAMKLGLETMRLLAAGCGDPQLRFPAVHIAGTNGKGSTSAFTESILRAAGIRCGLYTSPHLVSITERIKVDGVEIAPERFASLASIVRRNGEKLVAEGALPAPPTFFEQVTAIACLYFAESGVELAVLEVGMGGRLDATNICSPAVTAITPVGMDHQQYLGDTLARIAGEKAGIVKRGVPLVVAPQEREAMEVILARARELDARVTLAMEACSSGSLPAVGTADRGRYRINCECGPFKIDAALGLRGRHQVANASAAVAIAARLVEAGWEISADAVRSGLEKVEWPGRLEMIETGPGRAPVLLDGAHNIDGTRALRRFLDDHFADVPVTIVFGAMADKDIAEMADELFPAASRIVLTRASNQRAEPVEKLSALARKFNDVTFASATSAEALATAFALTPPSGLICVSGSLYLVGEVRKAVVA